MEFPLNFLMHNGRINRKFCFHAQINYKRLLIESQSFHLLEPFHFSLFHLKTYDRHLQLVDSRRERANNDVF